MEGLDNLDQVLMHLPSEGTAIPLAHEPDFAEKRALITRFNLQLSVHTHGGQVNTPYLGALILPKMGKRFLPVYI